MLFVIAPRMTGADPDSGTRFVHALYEQLDPVRFAFIEGDRDLPPHEPVQADDGVVLFNPRQPVRSGIGRPLREFLEAVIGVGAHVMPVALDDRSRQPPPEIGDDCASFSVVDRLTSCAIPPNEIRDGARLFARVVRAVLQPTLSADHLQLFLSHRWSDGRHLVERLDRVLQAQRHGAFRDVLDIRPGARLVPAITTALEECDVLVLLDTPDARDSAWLKSETCLALGMGVPIVWVRFGPTVDRPELPIWPSGQPDIERADVPRTDDELNSLAHDIIGHAFEAARSHVRRADACLRRARRYASVRTLDERQQIFELTRPRPPLGRFPVRPERHVVQIFGRRPTPKDHRAFVGWLADHDFHPEDERSRGFDIAIMMSPSTSTTNPVVGGSVVATHGTGFVSALAGELSPRALDVSGRRPELLLLAAFPRGAGAGFELRDAVHDIVTTWFAHGGSLRFGGHPSITPLVNYVAQREVPGEERERVTIYQSLYFQTPDALREVAELSTVVATPATGTGDEHRSPSLRVMREHMILGSNASAAVIIGGRTDEGGTHPPGVVEELGLARDDGIPCYVLGSTGGQAALIVDQEESRAVPWSGLANRLSADDNAWLAHTDDYAGAADLIWSTSQGWDEEA